MSINSKEAERVDAQTLGAGKMHSDRLRRHDNTVQPARARTLPPMVGSDASSSILPPETRDSGRKTGTSSVTSCDGTRSGQSACNMFGRRRGQHVLGPLKDIVSKQQE